VSEAAGNITITVLHNGKPAPGAEIVVSNAGVEEEPSVLADAKGQLTVPKPKTDLAIRALVVEKAKGKHGGLDYEHVRRYCSLTVGTFEAKLLTQIVREAFGNFHDVVGETLFIETLWSGKLKKPQLADHLQQRALIHAEIDRILGTSAGMPYGPEQKAVLSFLREDMSAAKIAWPTEKQTWKLTQGLLDEMRKSEAKGPYFTLGVFHVYYGGITAGGRSIGAKIKDTVGVDLTYYRLSDGYAGYRQKIDQIFDPGPNRKWFAAG